MVNELGVASSMSGCCMQRVSVYTLGKRYLSFNRSLSLYKMRVSSHFYVTLLALIAGFTMGVLLASSVLGPRATVERSDLDLSSRIFKFEDSKRLIINRKRDQEAGFTRENEGDRGEKCVCGEEMERLKRLARVALHRQNYTLFKNCLGDLAPVEPVENMDAMMQFLYPPDEDPIVDFRDRRRKLFRPGSRSEPRTLRDEYVFKKRLLVGVLTQQEYLPTRAKALYETWGKEVDKLILFVGEDCNVSADLMHLPIVKLKGVPDHVYPPLKKAFAVMKYMYSQHINEFNWFIRADDDMYVRTKKLTDLLDKMNPYERVYLGRAGAGRKEDLKRLELLPHERYCMGGPGVILSNGAMRGVGPHLDNCLNAGMWGIPLCTTVFTTHQLSLSSSLSLSLSPSSLSTSLIHTSLTHSLTPSHNHLPHTSTVLHHDAHSDDKWNDDDVEIGRCLSRKIDTQCSSSAEVSSISLSLSSISLSLSLSLPSLSPLYLSHSLSLIFSLHPSPFLFLSPFYPVPIT